MHVFKCQTPRTGSTAASGSEAKATDHDIVKKLEQIAAADGTGKTISQEKITVQEPRTPAGLTVSRASSRSMDAGPPSASKTQRLQKSKVCLPRWSKSHKSSK